MAKHQGMFDCFPGEPPKGEWAMSRLFFNRIASQTPELVAFCPNYIALHGEKDAAWVTREKVEMPGERHKNGRPKTEWALRMHEIEVKCSRSDFLREFKDGGTKSHKWAAYKAAAAGGPTKGIPYRYSVFLRDGAKWPLELLPDFVGIYNVVAEEYRPYEGRRWNAVTLAYEERFGDPRPGHRVVKIRGPKTIHNDRFADIDDIAKSLSYRYHSRTKDPGEEPEYSI